MQEISPRTKTPTENKQKNTYFCSWEQHCSNSHLRDSILLPTFATSPLIFKCFVIVLSVVLIIYGCFLERFTLKKLWVLFKQKSHKFLFLSSLMYVKIWIITILTNVGLFQLYLIFASCIFTQIFWLKIKRNPKLLHYNTG